MNAKPCQWECEKCHTWKNTPAAAEMCCQPKPEKPLDFAALRSNIEIVSGMSVSFEIADATGDEFSIDELRALKHVARDVPRLIDLAERCEAAEKEAERLTKERDRMRKHVQAAKEVADTYLKNPPEALYDKVVVMGIAINQSEKECDRLTAELALEKEQSRSFWNLANSRDELVEQLNRKLAEIEKERDWLKADNKKLATDCTELGITRDLLKMAVEGHEIAANRLKAEIAALKSAAPTLNWRQGFPVGTWVVYAVRNSLGSVGFADGAEVVCGGIETRNGVLRKWSDGIFAIPFDELAATLPASDSSEGC